MSVALTGNDTNIIGGRVLSDFGDGDVVEIKFDDDSVVVVNGKNDNAIYALNSKGKSATVTVKFLRATPDDIFFMSQYNLMVADMPSYVLMNGNFTKRIGTGLGAVLADSYLATGGVVVRPPDATSSSDGKTDDAQALYTFKFAKMIRVI